MWNWISEVPPTWVLWIGGFGAIFGVVAFLVEAWMMMAAMLQRRFGKPAITLEFDRAVEEQERALVVFIKNPTVNPKRWLLRIFGVHRETVQSLTAAFRLSEVGSGKILIPNLQARIYSDDDPTDEGRYRIMLPQTFSVAASIMVARWDMKSNKAVVPPDRLRAVYELAPGYYRAHIVLLIDGAEMHVGRNFVVGEQADDLVWA